MRKFAIAYKRCVEIDRGLFGAVGEIVRDEDGVWKAFANENRKIGGGCSPLAAGWPADRA